MKRAEYTIAMGENDRKGGSLGMNARILILASGNELKPVQNLIISAIIPPPMQKLMLEINFLRLVTADVLLWLCRRALCEDANTSLILRSRPATAFAAMEGYQKYRQSRQQCHGGPESAIVDLT